MPKNSVKYQFNNVFSPLKNRLSAAGAIVSSFVIIGSMAIAHAATIQQQIDSLNAQNAQTAQSVDSLQLQANSYQDAINKLQDQITSIESAIAASEAQQAQLQQQITGAETNIAQQKKFLGEDIKSMYVDGQLSTIEQLATSKNLSDYVDKEEYRTSVQNKINTLIKQISALEAQLKTQKAQADQLLATQQQQQAKLNADRQQQNNLLAMTESQQNQYTQQINANKKQISALQAEQARINAANSRAVNIQASGGSGGACDSGNGNGGYPMVWCNAAQDTIPTIPYSSDPINRECTSFAYWYFTSVEGKSLHVTGNAKDWAYTANRPVDHTPEDGAIAISTAGAYGHALIVLATPGETYHGVTAPAGYVITMSMNYDYYGHFKVDERAVSSLYYIH